MTAQNDPSAQSASGDLVVTRIFDAPRELVWQAWTDPTHLMRWWGPEGFSAPTSNIDLRVGGKYHFCMRSPDGQEFWTTGVYQEVEAPERLVFTDSFADADGNVVAASHYGMVGEWPLTQQVTVTLESGPDGTTKPTLRHTDIPGAEVSEMTGASWLASFEKLAASFAEGVDAAFAFPAGREIVTTRTIDARRELVFGAWTDPMHVGQWWGPDGFTTTAHEIDIRPGGVWEFTMHGPDGVDYPNRIVFEEIAPPERLVYAHGEAAGDPSQFRSTVTFTALGERTLLTMRSEFVTVAMRDQCIQDHGAIEGGRQHLARLGGYVRAL